MAEHRKSRLRTHTEGTGKHDIAMPTEYFQDTVRNQLCSLLEEDALKDTRITLRAKSLNISSCILSLLSPVLRTMVCGAFIEGIRKQISLVDIEAEVLMKLLRLACGKEGLVAEDAEELLELGELAERLQMEEVRVVIEDKLLNELKMDNCLEMIQRIEVSGLELLQKDCYKTLREHFGVISQREGFLKLSEETMGNLLDEDELWVDREEEVFEALAKWLGNSNEGKRAEALLRKVRYGAISNEYLAGLISHESVIAHRILKELVGEAMAKKGEKTGEGVWDGVERLGEKWNLARMRGSIVGAHVLKRPEYVAVDEQGRIVVCDSELNEIIIFNRDGSVARRIGSRGATAGKFHVPTGVAVDRQGHIIVADGANHRIQVLNADGSVARCFGSQGSEVGQLDGPNGVAVDREGHVVVADYWNDRIQVFNMDGSVVRHFGSRGSAIGQLHRPAGVAVDGAGRIVVTDWDNHRVQVFNADGSVALCFGSEGDGPGQFKHPDGVAVDSAGRFVVADLRHDRIQVFNPDGSLARVIGSSGSGVGQLRQPGGVVVDGAGRIVVAEGGGNHRVQVL